MPSRLESLLGFLEKDPDDSFTRYAVGLEYIATGDETAGERYMKETIERDGDYLPAYQQLGQLYGRNGELEESVKVYKAGIEVAARLGEQHAQSEMEQELEEIQDDL